MTLVLSMTFANVCQAQTNQFNSDELKKIDKALIELKSCQDANDLNSKQLANDMMQFDLLNQKWSTEHQYVLETKKIYLDSLETLKTFRDHKRPLLVKIITLSIVRDFHDKDLQKKIDDLHNEIMNWK